MEPKEQPSARPNAPSLRARLPLTPLGAAAFARASLTQLWVVQFVFALLIACVCSWFVATAWFPPVTAAIRLLPETGRIADGKLEWNDPNPEILSENRFLALSVDLNHEGQARSPAHVQLEFGATNLVVFSLFGRVTFPYAPDYVVQFNRPELDPWWGAWAPPILGLATLAGVVVFMTSWFLLGCLYWGPAWIFAFFCNRDLSWSGAWRLAGAALLPGAVFQAGAILLYGLGALDILHLLLAWVLHLMIGWIFLAATVLTCPRLKGIPVRGNPFKVPAQP
jgi:hypothetical protein